MMLLTLEHLTLLLIVRNLNYHNVAALVVHS